LILLGVPPLVGYNYITPRRAGLSATAALSCTYKHSTFLSSERQTSQLCINRNEFTNHSLAFYYQTILSKCFYYVHIGIFFIVEFRSVNFY